MTPTIRDSDTPEIFWDRHWSGMTRHSNGRPAAALERLVAGRPAGRTVDLGCGRRDDAVLLAKKGWQVFAVDVLQSALEAVQRSSEKAGVAG